MKFSVQYVVEIDPDGWALEYACEPDEVAEQVMRDLTDWSVHVFTEPKWDGLATPPDPRRVKVTVVE